jgi:very-short-patch-repair endonuclease
MEEWISRIDESRLTIDAAKRELQAVFHRHVQTEVARLLPGEFGSEVAAVKTDMSDFGAAGQLGQDAFGEEWKGLDSDWSGLNAIVDWDRECQEAGLAWNHREMLSRLNADELLRRSLEVLRATLKPAFSRLQGIVKSLEFDVFKTLGADSLLTVPIESLVDRLGLWRQQPEALSKWIGYRARRTRLEHFGLGNLLAGLDAGHISINAAGDQFAVAYYQSIIRAAFQADRALAEFDGPAHDQVVQRFRDLDRARVALARSEVAFAHYNGMPRGVAGEMMVVHREIEKKRRHKPIRQLIKDAGTAIQAIKPVFMMSPISIAQYLEPGSVSFDLLIIDEASQVSPVDAFGAMARAKQVVVVGDDKQLPPTRFFRKMLDDDTSTEDEDSGLNTGDLESILGLCVAQGISQRTLRWHYRSRHHSLIAVSNREFYDHLLYVVPSPTTITAMHGLHFHLVKDGIFDRGNTATNRIEARAVAHAVIEHAASYPQKSLGVGAFSVAQRDAIRDELELLQRERSDLSSFFSAGKTEPLFVKNLENIQGDERDVIFISVGYARDQSGFLTMSFGPLSSEGGERRLNVLISRARERCEVFSSIQADDIDLQRARSRGAAAFKTFLRYAATGVLDEQEPTGGKYDSDFERQVARSLEDLGHEVHCQVGTAGFLIDLAVVDRTRPGRYILGIECDGATYHSSRSARDRDRLRELVLRDRGWRIHRIWSTDWFHRPNEQLLKVVRAIETAQTEEDRFVEDEELAQSESDPVGASEVERVSPGVAPIDGASPEWLVPYAEADFGVPSETAIHETSRSVLCDIVARVVTIEGPVHRDEIARRITSLWGQQRTGGRIVEAVGKAIETAVGTGVLSDESGFISHSENATIHVRSRLHVSSLPLRRPEMLPPAEIRAAIRHLANEQVGVHVDEMPMIVGRVLGFKATSAKLKEVISRALGESVDNGSVLLRDSKVFPV